MQWTPVLFILQDFRFSRCLSILRPDCPLIGAMLANETLHELRIALQLAEMERLGGIGLHISPFVRADDVGSLMSRAGFGMITLDTDELTVIVIFHLKTTSGHWSINFCFHGIENNLISNWGTKNIAEVYQMLKLVKLHQKLACHSFPDWFLFFLIFKICFFQVGYPNIFALLYDLQSMGESNALRNRSMHLRRDILIAADAIYR